MCCIGVKDGLSSSADGRTRPSEQTSTTTHAVPHRHSTQLPVESDHSSSGYVIELASDESMIAEQRRQLQLPHRSRMPHRVFPIATDPTQNDKAREIRLCSTSQPHMRAFHFAWLSFFISFFGWFVIPPLLPTIKRELKLSRREVDNSNIAAVASTIIGRVITGPLCDRYGPRAVQATLLVVGAIPVASAALMTNYASFVAVRFFIGIIGCSFVATTYWTSMMFCSEIVGRANALAAGWGNLGAGVSYLLTPVLFDLITVHAGVSDNTGWRITVLLPAIAMVVVGVGLYRCADDCPQGNYSDLKPSTSTATRAASTQSADSQTSQATIAVSAAKAVALDVVRSVRLAIGHSATWLLAYQYACSFGVELTVHNVLSLHYYEDFQQPPSTNCDPRTDANECRLLTQTTASLISSLFGLMCIIARAAGGYASDIANLSYGVRGRIKIHCVAFAAQAVLLFLYSRSSTTDLLWNIVLLVAFALFVQACTGTTYAIVPYVAPHAVGATTGFVAAGGNVGAVAWGVLFAIVKSRNDAFQYLSLFVGAAAAMAPLIDLEGHAFDWTLAAIAAERRGPFSQTPSEQSSQQRQQRQSSQQYPQQPQHVPSRHDRTPDTQFTAYT